MPELDRVQGGAFSPHCPHRQLRSSRRPPAANRDNSKLARRGVPTPAATCTGLSLGSALACCGAGCRLRGSVPEACHSLFMPIVDTHGAKEMSQSIAQWSSGAGGSSTETVRLWA